MQISKNLLRIIFMLSTIVAVTDCCSSRILLLKEQTFNIIQQQKMQQQQQHQQYNGHQPVDEKYKQHVYSGNTGSEQITNNKNHTNINADDVTTSSDNKLGEGANNDRPPPPSKGGGGGGGYASTSQPFGDIGKKLSNLIITDMATGKKHADNPGQQLLDIYQSIMDNVLSFACTGQFLTDFCLNGGRCFRVPMGNQSLFSCECADGYVGERCESKSVNGVFVPSSVLDNKKPKILTARIVFSFPMLIFLTVIYLFFGMVIVFKCQPSFRSKYSPHSSRAAGLLFT